ncbi:MAG: Hsp70 family protein [Pseudomonadales bacterium]
MIEAFVERSVRCCRNTAMPKFQRRSCACGDGGRLNALPVVRKVVGVFARVPLTDIDPDSVVASAGAAIQTDQWSAIVPTVNCCCWMLIPLSLGLRNHGRLGGKIIPRNTTVQLLRRRSSPLSKDGQTAMSIHVLQGEREMVTDCHSLYR